MRPIIVVGPERSGTSAWTEMIHTWGAFAGESKELSAPDRLNPRGRWEYAPLWDLLARIGDFEAGVSWWEESFAAQVAHQANNPEVASRARDLLARMESTGRPWVWKDPALCHFLGFWTAFWDQPVYIVTVRNPLDIARSWQQFTRTSGPGLSVQCNLLRWQHMATSALRGTNASPTKRFVEYEQLVSDPVGQARALAGFLDDQFATTTPDTRIQEMAGVCDPALWRNRTPPDDRANPLSDVQRALYRFQQARVADPCFPFPAGEFPLPAGWRTRVIEEEAQARDRNR